MCVCCTVDQLRGDAHLIVAVTNASLHDHFDIQLVCNLRDGLSAVWILQHRSSGDDVEGLDFCELVENFLMNAGCKIRIVLGSGLRFSNGSTAMELGNLSGISSVLSSKDAVDTFSGGGDEATSEVLEFSC